MNIETVEAHHPTNTVEIVGITALLGTIETAAPQNHLVSQGKNRTTVTISVRCVNHVIKETTEMVVETEEMVEMREKETGTSVIAENLPATTEANESVSGTGNESVIETETEIEIEETTTDFYVANFNKDTALTCPINLTVFI